MAARQQIEPDREVSLSGPRLRPAGARRGRPRAPAGAVRDVMQLSVGSATARSSGQVGSAPVVVPLRAGQEPHARELLARLAADAGVHLNHRGIWVLQVIGAQPGLSNKEVAERAGGLGKGHVCVLLGRLKRLGLIENTQDDPTPYVPNAWRLTSSGRKLERAVRHATPVVGQSNGARGMRVGDSRADGLPAAANGVSDPLRARIVAAAVRVASAEGVRAVSVERLVRLARVSREGFDELFDDCDAVLLAAFDDALAQASARVEAAGRQEGWLERARAGVLALLELFDEQPALAALLVVGSAEAGPLLRARRDEVLAGLARLLDDERAPARRYPPPLTAEAVVSGVLGVLHAQLARSDHGSLVELCNQLMSFIVLPFLGAGAARRELSRPVATAHTLAGRKAALELLHGFSGRAMRHPLAPRVLSVIGAEPGMSNIEVARRAGVADEGHMSRVLARLSRLGLVEKGPQAAGQPGRNVWRLTSSGEELERALRCEVSPSRRELSAPVAVSETATAILRVQARAWRSYVRRRVMERWRAIEHLLRLAALAFPLLHCICPGGLRALPAAIARWSWWLNKRRQARYSISLRSVKPEASATRVGGRRPAQVGVRKRPRSVCEPRCWRSVSPSPMRSCACTAVTQACPSPYPHVDHPGPRAAW